MKQPTKEDLSVAYEGLNQAFDECEQLLAEWGLGIEVSVHIPPNHGKLVHTKRWGLHWHPPGNYPRRTPIGSAPADVRIAAAPVINSLLTEVLQLAEARRLQLEEAAGHVRETTAQMRAKGPKRSTEE